MVKVQDTYNPVTGEYVKRISDWVTLDGGLFNGSWVNYPSGLSGTRSVRPNVQVLTNALNNVSIFRNDSVPIDGFIQVPEQSPYVYLTNELTGWNNTISSGNSKITINETKAYFYGWKMCNADGTSPYYKSEVPYTPATWAEWNQWSGDKTISNNSVTLVRSEGNTSGYLKVGRTDLNLKTSTKYGILVNVPANTSDVFIKTDGGVTSGNELVVPANTIGNFKKVVTTLSTITTQSFGLYTWGTQLNGLIVIKDFRIFELPTGSQIEADFTNLTADELSSKYTFNGLCIKNWKKVTDGTGLTSTLPTASYAGYTPYKMIYQLATPEISYLTPKTTIPLYDTNTIVETDTLADCKADVTVGYKLKNGVTAIAGDITAPTPDYVSAVNSVSEDGLGKGIVRGKNLLNPTWLSDTIKNSLTSSGITFTYNSDGSFKTVGTLGAAMTHHSQELVPKNIFQVGKTYYLSGTRSLFQVNTGGILSWVRSFVMQSNTTSVTAYWQVQQVGLVLNETCYMQIQESSIDNAFEKYSGYTTATLPTLRKIGTVADTYNPETGVLVQRIGKKVFDGTENWSSTGIAQINTQEFQTTSITNAFSNQAKDVVCYSNSFKWFDADILWMTDIAGIAINDTGTFQVRIEKEHANTPSQFKAYLAQQYTNGTPVTVYYQLATPVVTTLTKTALPTYKPTTVIESDSTVKGNVSADYKLKPYATPVAGDFLASPESVNDIKDLGNSIDVVSSVGRRNLLSNTNKGITNWSVGVGVGTKTLEEYIDESLTRCTKLGVGYDAVSYRYASYSINLNKIDSGKKYVLSFDCLPSSNRTIGISIMRGDATNSLGSFPTHSVTNGVWNHYSKEVTINTTEKNGQVIYFHGDMLPLGETIIVKNLKLEESENSPYAPSPEEIPYNTIINGVYKTNILLNAPLRSIGAVKDRLFKDSDGKWKIERNVGEKVFNGTEIWANSPDVNWNKDTNYFQSEISITNMKEVTDSPVVCNLLPQELFTVSYNGVNKKETISSHSSARIIVILDRKRLSSPSVGAVASWVGANSLTVQYQLATPTYEILSQDLQTKLDNIPTFPEHNYVYTVTNDNLQPTLHVDYKKLSWLKSRLLLNSLKIYSRNLTDAEMIQNYKVEKERFGM